MPPQPKQKNSDLGFTEYRTPSQSPFPVLVLCQPCYYDIATENNVWMKEATGKDDIPDKEKMMGEWFKFYQLLAADSLVYLLPPRKGLQDQVFVNSFCYLEHLRDKDVVILSNFEAKGRAGEEDVAGKFLQSMGYQCIKSPFKFEGYPELKYLRDNIYIGSHGIRTDIRAHKWIEKTFGAKIITVKLTDPYLYHGDCMFFVFDETNVMMCCELAGKEAVKQIEKVATIHDVSVKDCWEDICNVVRVGDLIICASSVQFMKDTDPLYKLQKHKNQSLEKICNNLGLEMIIVELSENAKSGAAASCLATPLNRR